MVDTPVLGTGGPWPWRFESSPGYQARFCMPKVCRLLAASSEGARTYNERRRAFISRWSKMHVQSNVFQNS